MSEYSVEQIDEDAMTEFIQAQQCRRRVLSGYFDEVVDGSDCHSTDSVFCDWCKTTNRSGGGQSQAATARRTSTKAEEPKERVPDERSGSQVIAARLKSSQEWHERMISVMDQLQGQCIYCTLINQGDMGESITGGVGTEGQAHAYSDCFEAEADGCGFIAYEQWRERLDLGQLQHCWKCGLSQEVCRRLEDDGWCEYPDIALPGMFILQQRGHLQMIVETVGFQGDFEGDVWEWFNELADGNGGKWQSNWMRTWEGVCGMYRSMMR
jgi:hypothetical protein